MAVFFGIVFITYLVLYIVDIYPEPKTDDEETVSAVAVTTDTDLVPEEIPQIVAEAPTVAADPLRIIFDSLDKDVTVLNPTANDVASLDAALLRGVVRHPDSANFSQPGNIFILGHSSYLPNVLNRNFQAFNGIQKLKWGDTIRLQSADTEYTYRVERVYMAKAAEIVVPTDGDEARLTLATCNSFGSKDDRYMVESKLISTKAL